MPVCFWNIQVKKRVLNNLELSSIFPAVSFPISPRDAKKQPCVRENVHISRISGKGGGGRKATNILSLNISRILFFSMTAENIHNFIEKMGSSEKILHSSPPLPQMALNKRMKELQTEFRNNLLQRWRIPGKGAIILAHTPSRHR